MAIVTGERSFHKVQIGYESTEGTEADATFLFPCESGSIIEIDRAADTPEEDYGELSMAQPGRSVFGVRQATMPLRGVVRFEDIFRILQSAIAGGVTPSGTDPYTWSFVMDNDADTLDPMTVEDGDQIQAYLMLGAFVQSLTLSYDALSAGSASPWTFEATLIGRDKQATSFTGSVTAPSSMETVMGHLTRLYLGDTATAFASLSEVTGSLLSFSVSIETGIVLRKQGGSDDVADNHGREKVSATFTALVEQTAATKSAVWDDFESDGTNPVQPTKRLRIQAQGNGDREFTIDGAIQIEGVPTQEGDGSTRYSVEGHYVKDATIGGLIQIDVVNGIAS